MRTTKQCVSFGSSKCKTKGEVVFCRMNACRSLQQVQNIKRCLIKERLAEHHTRNSPTIGQLTVSFLLMLFD